MGDKESVQQKSILGRRGFLGGLGAGVAGALLLADVEALAEQVEGPTVAAEPDPGDFRMTDLLRWTRVDPVSRGTAP